MSLENTRRQGHQVTNSQISMSPVWLRSWFRLKSTKKERQKKKTKISGQVGKLMLGWIDVWFCLACLFTSFAPFLHVNVETIKIGHHPTCPKKDTTIIWLSFGWNAPTFTWTLKLNKTPLRQNVIVLVVTITGRGVHCHIPTRWAPTSYKWRYNPYKYRYNPSYPCTFGHL